MVYSLFYTASNGCHTVFYTGNYSGWNSGNRDSAASDDSCGYTAVHNGKGAEAGIWNLNIEVIQNGKIIRNGRDSRYC